MPFKEKATDYEAAVVIGCDWPCGILQAVKSGTSVHQSDCSDDTPEFAETDRRSGPDVEGETAGASLLSLH